MEIWRNLPDRSRESCSFQEVQLGAEMQISLPKVCFSGPGASRSERIAMFAKGSGKGSTAERR